MGSKRTLLNSNLGKLIAESAERTTRFVDLFCGAGSVSWFASNQLSKRVLSCDLQNYAAILAGSVIERTDPVDWRQISKVWLSAARGVLKTSERWQGAREVDSSTTDMAVWQERAKELCEACVDEESTLIFRCYGGHYFSPSQALALDAMLQTLPTSNRIRKVCLAAAIISASNCVAAPGHTAQPFKATPTARKYLYEAWCRDPFLYASKALQRLCPLYAVHRGESLVADANELAVELTAKDLVFVDPPYSAVQYSRFYHVLETMACGSCTSVSGVGRYPPPSDRPKSRYSQKSRSSEAMFDLLDTLSNRGCEVVVTFPRNECSNGLSGEGIEEMAKTCFRVKRHSIGSKLSTLGGNKINRTARRQLEEFILVLTTK